MQFGHDELVLALVSLISVTDPQMLQQGPDGFTVDLSPLKDKRNLNSDEELLVKLRAAFTATAPEGPYEVELGAEESQRLVQTLTRLEELRSWPADVVALSTRLRARIERAAQC